MGTPDNTEKARALADGLRQLAAFVEIHPELYGDLSGVANARLAYIIGNPTVRDRMLTIARAAIAAGATASERAEAKWANLDLAFGPVKVQVYTDRSWLMAEPQPPVEVPSYPSLLAEIEPVCNGECDELTCWWSPTCPAHRQYADPELRGEAGDA